MSRSFKISSFYCIQCANKTSLPRKSSSIREKGHLKKLHCVKCRCEVNHYEVREFDVDFSLEDFKNKILAGGFTNEKDIQV
jgi:hypothetical protein